MGGARGGACIVGGSLGGVTTGDRLGGVGAGNGTLGDGRVTGVTTLGEDALVGGTEETGVVVRVKMSLRRWIAPRRTSSGV